jgi:hypothetical protein
MRAERGRPVAGYGLVSSAVAPVLLIGGWTVAAARQQGGFDSLERTISDLAAYGADDRWIMTTALAGLGVCHLTTAAALRDAAGSAGRAVLAAGVSRRSWSQSSRCRPTRADRRRTPWWPAPPSSRCRCGRLSPPGVTARRWFGRSR